MSSARRTLVLALLGPFLHGPVYSGEVLHLALTQYVILFLCPKTILIYGTLRASVISFSLCNAHVIRAMGLLLLLLFAFFPHKTKTQNRRCTCHKIQNSGFWSAKDAFTSLSRIVCHCILPIEFLMYTFINIRVV